MDDALDLFLGKLEGVRQQAGYWMARCPAHDDREASLSVKRGTDQPVIFKCHAGCERDAILEATGLILADVSAPRKERPAEGEWTPRGTAVNVYDYTDEEGTLLFQVLRTADKQFPQRIPDRTKKSGWKWSLGTTRRVPYRLPAVIRAIAEHRVVYIVEGEKDVHAIERAGAVATTSPGGAGKWRPDYNEFFAGASVVIIADADEPGRKHAADVAKNLRDIAGNVRIAEPAYGKDASDHLAAGHGLEFIASRIIDTITFTVIELEPAALTIEPPIPICGDMLYTGAVHTLSGPPDCGKTTLACWWMLTVIRDGGTALFLDEEGGLEIVAEKFKALGARAGERLGYVPFPSSTWEPSDVAMLAQLMAQRKPGIVMWDSSAAFLSKAGLDENSAADVTKFYSDVLMPAARLHGSAVVVIDHDTKNSELSRYARGSGAKLAATDVAYKIAQVTPFSKGQSGASKLTVTKDRRGWLHRNHEVTFAAADGRDEIEITIRQAGSDYVSGSGNLSPAQQKILFVLTGQPSSVREITDRIVAHYGHGLRRETVSRELNKLLKLGLADQVTGSFGNASLWMVTNAL